MKQGALIFDEQTDRYDIRFDLADYYGGLHCGETFDVMVGGRWRPTRIEMAENWYLVGKETIDSYNQSENRGAQTSHGLNYQKLGKELMSQDEIATMDGGKCILQVRGVRPFFSEKYDITRHPRYKYLSDADKKNTFDVDSYLSSLRRKKRRVITEDEPFDLYDIELSDEDFAAE